MNYMFSPNNHFFPLRNRVSLSMFGPEQVSGILRAGKHSEANMELKHSKSTNGKKTVQKKHVIIGIPMSSAEYAFSFKSCPKELLADPVDQYQLMPSPSTRHIKPFIAPKPRIHSFHGHKFESFTNMIFFEGKSGRVGAVICKMTKLRERMDVFAQGIREHVRLGPKLSKTVKGKLSLGATILQVGGVEKVFSHKFNIRDDEILLKASQCCLSTTAGPMAGLLFISSNRVAFCSDRSIKVSSPAGKLLKVHYKMTIPLRNIKRVNESENVKKPRQKYVQVVTEDNFEFWFMGFLNHQRNLKYLQHAILQAR